MRESMVLLLFLINFGIMRAETIFPSHAFIREETAGIVLSCLQLSTRVIHNVLFIEQVGGVAHQVFLQPFIAAVLKY